MDGGRPSTDSCGMRGVVGLSVVRKILVVGVVAALIPAVAYGRRADSGILTICNASGARPVTGTFVYTAAAPGAAGGTMVFNVAVGSCAPRVFYPLGTSVTVSETVPSGDLVTAITLIPTAGGGGTTSVISASTPAAGSANVTIGTGQATLTFTTSSKSGGIPCTVPNVFGLGLTAAKAAIRRAHCSLGAVRKAHSNIYYPGIVYSQSPPRGTVLAPRARVTLTVSLGHHR
jgi:hypothetical protein